MPYESLSQLIGVIPHCFGNPEWFGVGTSCYACLDSLEGVFHYQNHSTIYQPLLLR